MTTKRIRRPSKEFLYREYITNKREAKDIAKELGVHPTTINKWTTQYGIKKERGKYLDTKPTDDQLYTDYILDCIPMAEMVEKYRAPESTIRNWIADAELSRRANYRIVSEEAMALLQEYESSDAITMDYLSKKHDMSMSRVYRYLKRGREIKKGLEKKGMVRA